MQYRVVGTGEWLEQVILVTHTTYNPLLEGLQSGAAYEYRCVLEDLGGNQLITDWEALEFQVLGASMAGATPKINASAQEVQIESGRLVIENIQPDQLIWLNINVEETPKKGKGVNRVHGTVTVPRKNRDSGYHYAFSAKKDSLASALAEAIAVATKYQYPSEGVIIKTKNWKRKQRAHDAKTHYLAEEKYSSSKFRGHSFSQGFSLFEKDLTAALLSDDAIGECYSRWLDGI